MQLSTIYETMSCCRTCPVLSSWWPQELMRGPSGDGGKSATTMAAQVRRQGWTGTADLPEDIVVPLRCLPRSEKVVGTRQRGKSPNTTPCPWCCCQNLLMSYGRGACVAQWSVCVMSFSDGYRAHANCRCSLISQFQGERRHMTHVHCSSNLLRNYADDMYSQLARDRSMS